MDYFWNIGSMCKYVQKPTGTGLDRPVTQAATRHGPLTKHIQTNELSKMKKYGPILDLFY